jgi:hypothetical protein
MQSQAHISINGKKEIVLMRSLYLIRFHLFIYGGKISAPLS